LYTLERVRSAGISVCCGGILGMGEGEHDRVRLLATLANLSPPPESVPINALVAVEGTPLARPAPDAPRPTLDPFEFVRAIATARILMPRSRVRLSAGRLALSDEAQALCFYAGANSIFVGEKLLTTPNPEVGHDHRLLQTIGLRPEKSGQGSAFSHPRQPQPLEQALEHRLAEREQQHLRRRLRRPDTVFSDACNHASLIDGIRLSGARAVIVPHNDSGAFAAALRRHPAMQGQRRWLVVESLYSMDGDLAPLEDYASICAHSGVAMIVDEAHATGLFGRDGAGFVAAGSPRLRAAVAAHLHPCGKALGASGALAAGSRALIETLVNHSRGFVFSTAPAPLAAVQVAAAIRVIQREPARSADVRALALALRARLQAWGVSALGHPESPIVPVLVGEDARALAVEAELAAAGFDVRAIRPPSVPVGTARLRITVHAGQPASDLERLAGLLAAAMRVAPEAASVV